MKINWIIFSVSSVSESNYITSDAFFTQSLRNQNLQLCNFCRRESQIAEYDDTRGFHDLLDQQELLETTTELELDMLGRPLECDKITRAYRKEKNYTCEKCGFGGEMLLNNADKEFIHADHIIAWELANMRRNNLQCLCLLCHSQKDELHRRNFSKPGMQKRIKRFVEKYGQKLLEIGNPYIGNIT
jgi:hypothetical protein